MLVTGLLGAALLVGCSSGAGDADTSAPADQPGDVVLAWNDRVVDQIELNAIAAPAAGRVLAYTALAMHEALATGPAVTSYAGFVDDLPEPPTAEDEVHWPMVVAAAADDTAAAMLVSEDSRARLDELLDEQRAQLAAEADADVLARSEDLGREVAARIVAFAAEDGYAESADASFDPTGEEGRWEPTPPAFAPGLEPGWPTLRPFVVAPGDCDVPEAEPYAAEPGSAFYDEAMAVYETDAALDDEQREIAEYWNMEPNTGTPAGHWMRIIDEVAAAEGLDLARAAEASAIVSMTMHDSFIVGWDAKYDTDVVRPVTYIREHIDPDWLPWLVTPPFPEYPSGHSFVSASAAAAATAVLGERGFTDASNHGADARSFASFHDAALEAAQSRLYGGAHYPMGIESGTELGTCIGELAVERLGAGS